MVYDLFYKIYCCILKGILGGANLSYHFIAKHKKTLFYLCLCYSFLIMFFYFMVLPYSQVDDMAYMNNFATGEKISSILEIISSQISHWYGHSGRVLAHGNLQLLLFLDKPIIAIQQSLVMIINPILISKIASKDNKFKYSIVLLCISIFYFLNPVWTDVIWFTGFQVYVTTGIPILFFIYLFTQNIKFEKKTKSSLINNVFVMSILGFMAGCSVEAISVALCAVCFFMITYMIKEKTIEAKHIISYIFLIFGALILLLAPGNATRANYVYSIDPAFSFHNICVRIFNELHGFCNDGLGIFLLLLVCYQVTNKKKLENNKLHFFCNLIGILAMLSMLGAPQGFVRRVFITIMLILLIPISIYIENIDFGKYKDLKNQIVIILFLSFSFMMLYSSVFQYFNQ